MARISFNIVFASLLWLGAVRGITVPSAPPSGAATVDPALVSVSIEFFAFPGYTEMSGTENCLANLAALRGTSPAVRIGGTTQYESCCLPIFAAFYEMLNGLFIACLVEIARRMTPSCKQP